MSGRDVELGRDRGALAGPGDEDRDGCGPDPVFEVAEFLYRDVPHPGMRTLQADGRDDRELGSGVAGTAGQDVSGLETKAMAGLGVALQGESDGEIGVLAIGLDGAEAGGGDGRGAVLGQVGVLGQEPEWVVVEVAALKGLQRSDALREHSAGGKWGQSAPASVCEPGIEADWLGAGGHLNASRLLVSQPSLQEVLDLGVQGFLIMVWCRRTYASGGGRGGRGVDGAGARWTTTAGGRGLVGAEEGSRPVVGGGVRGC